MVFLGSQDSNVNSKTKDVALTTPYPVLNGALLRKVSLSLSSLIRRTLSTVDRRTVLRELKAGGNMKAVFWLGIMFLMQISCLRFKQSRISLLISHIYVLGCFVNFLVIFRYIWREIVFLKGLVKLMEIGNFEDLLLF